MSYSVPEDTVVRLNRILPSLTLVGALLLALPAEAARLQFWRFDPEENRLTFTTDDSIQPTAQLLSNPTRLVIDLPGTTLSQPEEQAMEGAIKTIRVGELDAETTRMIVEYNDGYSVDPDDVQVRGESARQWTVQLPAPVAIDSDSPVVQVRSGNRVSHRRVEAARTRIQGITTTADGFFIRTAGETAELDVVSGEEDGQRTIVLTVDDAAVALGLTTPSLPVNRYSVDAWQVNQVSADPAQATIKLVLGEASPDWEISASPGGIVVLPQDTSISDVPDEGGSPSPQPSIARETRETVANRQVSMSERPSLPDGRFTVVIDPGHGGRDPGAVGINGLQEKQVVNDIAPQVAEILREQGVNVVMTRERDVEVDLSPRVQVAERANASVFVSIHANAISMSRPDVNGLETFYASNAGQRLANTVHNHILQVMGIRDRRVRSARFYVIRRTSMPAILIETGFVTGAEDAPNLADPEWRARMSGAIAEGILLHLQRGL